MKDAAERRRLFSNAAAESQLEWEFFDAHCEPHAPLLTKHESGRRPLSKGELGCYSSHFALWKWLADSNYDQILVLEDDIVADWGFIKKLSSLDFHKMGVDYLKLFTKVPAKWRYVCTVFQYYHIVQLTNRGLGTQAYFLTKDGAKMLLRSGVQISFPVDIFLDTYWQNGMPSLAIHPSPIFERFQPSSIGEGRFRPTVLGPINRLASFLEKIRNKLRMSWEHIRPMRTKGFFKTIRSCIARQ